MTKTKTSLNCVLLAAAAIAAILALPQPAAAIQYPWCAEYAGEDSGGGTNCGFTTIEQCRLTISGMGGFCAPNPFYPEATTDKQPRKRKRNTNN